MSAREDAINRSPKPSARTTTLVLAALAGISLGIAVALVTAPASLPLFRARAPWTGGAPLASEWPEPARTGEDAAVAFVTASPGGAELEVHAPRAPRARRLAAGLATRRAAGVAALAAAREGLERRWREAVLAAPLPVLEPRAECAALLLADAARRRDAAGALPPAYAGGPGVHAPPDDAVARAESGLSAALLDADPDACMRALAALASAEDRSFSRGVPAADAPPAARGGAWRSAQLERALAHEGLAALALEELAPPQREFAVAAAPERLVRLAGAFGDPYAPLLASAPAVPVTVEPLPGPWSALLGLGAGLGGVVSLLAALLGLRVRNAFARERAPAAAAGASGALGRDPAAPQPWIHVVSAQAPANAVRAALELAAHALARRERVLLVDAGSGRLHERLGREARWGLMECLQGDMPVLGLVQYAGRPGFYLLARGHAARTAAWAGLGRCLDDARLHFGRVVFVIDRSTAREFGDALAGRPLEGWWAESGSRHAAGAAELSGRLGIAFSAIDLSAIPKVSLEVLGERVTALAAALPAAIEPTPLERAIPDPLPVAAVPAAPPEPVVLDCDLQVLQRLRFLAWMRRVQSESRQAEARPAHR